VKIALAQINVTVGDLTGNADKIIRYAADARRVHGADLAVFPELAICGYPPEDLLFRESFVDNCRQQLQRIAEACRDIVVLTGFPRRDGYTLYNSAALLLRGKIDQVYDKHILPNYGVFDEKRYFHPGNGSRVIEIAGHWLGIAVCEDIWSSGPAAEAVKTGADLILNINASPFHVGKTAERRKAVQKRCQENNVPVVYVNCVGGQDELVFDGASMVMDRKGELAYQAPAFEEHLGIVEFNQNLDIVRPQQQALPEEDAGVYQALVLAIRDYVRKNGFNGVVIGLSGGVDSALVLTLAVDALGADAVEAVMMPSRYTADMSLEDAEQLARNLGVNYEVVSIEPPFREFVHVLEPMFNHYKPDTTEENIQARCRGMILMAISNKKHRLVLTTGNKSEMAVGYATLYGDMAGGYAPLKDVSKGRVYKLCAYRNRYSLDEAQRTKSSGTILNRVAGPEGAHTREGVRNPGKSFAGEIIPRRILERAPSAELAPNQTDQDSLPPYDLLDRLIELYLEQERSVESIIGMGFDEKLVKDVVKKIDRNEYKRRQAAPGAKITKRAFGRERRYPITNGYKS
jgi:NAD+ synthase (glutamine-hydrolysing)